MRIVLMGLVVRFPLGGMAWHYLQFAMGLARLGHEVMYVEDSDDYASCYDPARFRTGTDPSYGLEFTARTFRDLALDVPWAYYDAHTRRWLGTSAASAESWIREADLLINVSGANPLRASATEVPHRVYLDTDPVFTQIRNLTSDRFKERVGMHNAYFTFGGMPGAPGNAIPDDGIAWKPTRQPVVLDAWPVTPGPAEGRFTTVMQWDSYSTREYEGRAYGTKAMSFGEIRNLPERVGVGLEVALGSDSAPREELRSAGWWLQDPQEVTLTCGSYRRYIQGSKGELSIAKHGYVAARSGWFSERSANYLASGRPVVVQDTGFSEYLPTGVGLLAFSTSEEAVEAIESVNGDYERHCRVAREVAEAHFGSDGVLTSLLERVG